MREIDTAARNRNMDESAYDELVPTRVMDIIDETWHDTIVLLQQNGGFLTDVCLSSTCCVITILTITYIFSFSTKISKEKA